MISKAIGDSKNTIGLMNQVVMTKANAMITTKMMAEVGLMTPEGISLSTVRAFCASMRLSVYLLNAIAALRAKSMHNKTRPSKRHSKLSPLSFRPRKKDNIANGNAKTVWANLMSEKYAFIA